MLSRIHGGQRLLGGLQFADEELAARSNQAGVKRIGVVAEAIERLRGGGEHVCPPGQIARGAARELARPLVVAELRHCSAPQGERRWVVAQRDALERTERITSRQQARSGGGEGVHGDRILMDAFGGKGTRRCFLRSRRNQSFDFFEPA
jgi:hypothetical protein